MVNEYAYCPRLFHLEWVSKQWADNLDTDEGRFHHRAVDREEGRVPPPGEDPPKIARSVRLSSDRLGLVAVVDVLESEDGTVVPVDTKRGSPPDNEHQAWEPERVQICVQAILLREAGYRCERGVLYFAGARRRVTVEIDNELLVRTIELTLGLREAAERAEPPPPLVDSPKCPRCSLVGICLPDEVNALAERSNRPPRRLVPSRSEARPLYLTEQGSWLHKKGDRLEVRRKDETLGSFRMIDVSQVCVFGNVHLTTGALGAAFDREIPVAWYSHGGWFRGLAEGLPGKNVELRRRQVLIDARGDGLDIARAMVSGKIRNSRVLLRRNRRSADPEPALAQLADAAAKARWAESVDSLLGIEGSAAKAYFGAFATMLRPEVTMPGEPFSFDGRHRRPPSDPINAMLGYLYGLLTKDLTIIARLVGFDPYLGFLHRPRFGRPALALDLAEEFRPLIAESVLLQLVNNGEVSGSDFTVRAGGVALTAGGRRSVLKAYERRLDHEITHPMFGYRATYRRILEVQVRLLGAHVMSEVDRYTPFVTR